MIYLLRCLIPIALAQLVFSGCATEVTGPFALQQSIAYHDPSTEWNTFDDTLRVLSTRPDGGFRHSTMHIDMARNIFSIRDSTNTHIISYRATSDSCLVRLNGSTDFTAQQRDSLHLTCERMSMLQDYYTFLYGLPMKLTDRGVDVVDTIRTSTFHGNEYIVVEARFGGNEEGDVWFLYLNPNSYRMEIYQFYKTDSNGQILPESGEYITLEGEFFIGGINLPKERSWYTNADDEFLGKDVLVKP